MQGKTKKLLEDISLLIIIVFLGIGVYFFFFSHNSKENVVVVEKKDSEQTLQKLSEKNIKEKKPALDKDEKSTILTNNIEELKKDQEKSQKSELIQNQHSIQEIDMEKLQFFLIQTKKKIKNSIDSSSINNDKESYLSIRITVLKNGTYEHFSYVGGDKNIFKNNIENMKKVFPLKIEKSIEGEFPRYLRYKFHFNQKDE